MRSLHHVPALTGLFLALAAPALAAPPVTYEVEGSFDEVATFVEEAIVNAGLVIDGRSKVGEMLARTKEDAGGGKDLYTAAEAFTFCSAVVSRQVMERDIQNVQYCPYSIFVYEAADKPGTIVVGHRDYAAEGIPEVSEMMEPIVKDALSLD